MVAGGAVVRGSVALVPDDLIAPDTDSMVERVRFDDQARWASEKRAGAGRG